MRRAEILQEIRRMRFEEAYSGYCKQRLTQEEAACLLGVCDRTFRRYISRYEEGGVEGLLDRRLMQPSSRKIPIDEEMALVDKYKRYHRGWKVRHFYKWYQRDGGSYSYSWVKYTLQSHGLVGKLTKQGVHRTRREPSPMAGMMLLQDGSTHEWVPAKKWDLILTMDDATNEHYSLFFVDQEGTESSFRAVKEVIYKKGLFCSLYTDRGSHYWLTPFTGKSVSKTELTQFGRAMKQLGIGMIPSYSPEARGRIERAFATHQDRLPKELAFYGITTMEEANRYIAQSYLPLFNVEFSHPPRQEGSAFVRLVSADLDEVLSKHYDRVVSGDNCVSFAGKTLQIPQDKYRCNFVRVNVKVHLYADGSLSVFHGPRKIASYNADGMLKVDAVRAKKEKLRQANDKL